MRSSKRREVPSRLSQLERRFAAWRKNRTRGERIPMPLWKSAAKAAANYGLHQTARALKLDYYSLKKHLDQRSESTTANDAFVPLPPTTTFLAGECVIEL